MPRNPHRRHDRGALLALLIVSWLFPRAQAQPNTSAAAANHATAIDSPGRVLSKQYCGACHVFPEPDLLDKKTWREQTLRRMKIRMGLSPAEIDRHPEANFIKET